jgi:hypothetical protein
MTFGMTLTQDATGTLIPGTPLDLNLAAPGQQALLTFSATQGQTFAVNVSSLATMPTGKAVSLYAYNSSGTQVASGGATLNLPNLSAGDYTILAIVPTAATATAQITLIDATFNLSNGTTANFNGVPGQIGYFWFNANAGDDLGLALTDLTLGPSSTTFVRVYVDKPGGGYWGPNGVTCSVSSAPGCAWSLRNAPVTGLYRVRVTHDYNVAMTFGMTLTQDATGTLTPGTPLDLDLAAPGQQALLNFDATAGETVTVTMNSIATTPGGKSVSMYAYNPSGAQVASTSSTTTATLNLTNLVVGTYTILVVPQNAASASGQMQIQ